MAVTDQAADQAAGHPARGSVVLRLTDVRFTYTLRRTGKQALLNSGGSTALGGILRRTGKRKITVTAVDGVSLEIHAGDRIGIFGNNGAGKSTLLRIMAGIYPAESGTVEVYGKVAAIFGQTHGMDPELTGFENIRVRGLFLGLSEAEIASKTDEIAEFSELGQYLDLPLRAYSPGMRMRLGFSASTSFSTDILLLDEWLSVGDKAFMIKAKDRMREFYEQAGTVVLVSHNRTLLEENCDVILTMEHGKIIDRSPVVRDGAAGNGGNKNAGPGTNGRGKAGSASVAV